MVPPVHSTSTSAAALWGSEGGAVGSGVTVAPVQARRPGFGEDSPLAEVAVTVSPRLWPAGDAPEDATPLLEGVLAGRSGLAVQWDSPAAARQFRRRRVPGLAWSEERDGEGRLWALTASAPDAALALLSVAELKAAARRIGARELLVWAPRASALRVVDAWAAGRVEAVQAVRDWGATLPGPPLGAPVLLVRDGVCCGVLDSERLLRADGSAEPFAAIAPAHDRMERSAAVLAAQVLLFGLGVATTLLVLMSLW